MSGPNEGAAPNRDEELLTSTNMRDLLGVSPEKMFELDQNTDGAASKFRALVKKAADKASEVKIRFLKDKSPKI